MDIATAIKELGTAGILAVFLWLFLKQYSRSLDTLERIVGNVIKSYEDIRNQLIAIKARIGSIEGYLQKHDFHISHTLEKELNTHEQD